MAGFDDLYRQGNAVTWQAGKEDVVRQVAELLMGLDKSSRLLDFGCGTGWPAPLLTSTGARYLGIDPSAEGIAAAEESHAGLPGVRFHQLSMGETLTEALQAVIGQWDDGKLGYTAQRTMRIAQQLYEGVDIGSGAAQLRVATGAAGPSIRNTPLAARRNLAAKLLRRSRLSRRAPRAASSSVVAALRYAA